MFRRLLVVGENLQLLLFYSWKLSHIDFLCREMSQMEEDARRKGLNVRLRNAEPYREFQNTEDNDRSESTNRLYRIQIRIWSQTFVAIFSLLELFLVTCVVFLSFLQCDLPL